MAFDAASTHFQHRNLSLFQFIETLAAPHYERTTVSSFRTFAADLERENAQRRLRRRDDGIQLVPRSMATDSNERVLQPLGGARPSAPLAPTLCCKCLPPERPGHCCPCDKGACDCDPFDDDTSRSLKCRDHLKTRSCFTLDALRMCVCPRATARHIDRFEVVTTTGIALGPDWSSVDSTGQAWPMVRVDGYGQILRPDSKWWKVQKKQELDKVQTTSLWRCIVSALPPA